MEISDAEFFLSVELPKKLAFKSKEPAPGCPLLVNKYQHVISIRSTFIKY